MYADKSGAFALRALPPGEYFVAAIPEQKSDTWQDPKLLETIMVEYEPLPGSALGELTATFDIRLGQTAVELDDGTIGGIGRAPA